MGSTLVGLAALITSVTGGIALLLGQRSNRNKVQEVHQLVNSQLSTQINRSNRKSDHIMMLEGLLKEAGGTVPLDTTD